MHGPGEASTSSSSASSNGKPSWSEGLASKLQEGVAIRGLLLRNTEEMDGVLRALNGEYVLPEAGGDLLRDGAGVLPTGAPACLPLYTFLVVCKGFTAAVLQHSQCAIKCWDLVLYLTRPPHARVHA